jgi:hypothetical protein
MVLEELTVVLKLITNVCFKNPVIEHQYDVGFEGFYGIYDTIEDIRSLGVVGGIRSKAVYEDATAIHLGKGRRNIFRL